MLILVAAEPAQAARRPALPDLVVARLAEPPATSPQGPLSLAYTVANRGRAGARRSSTGFYVSADRRFDRRDRRVATAPARKLARRGKRAAKGLLKLPALGRSMYVVACADVLKAVREGNERNNCRATRRRIRLPTAGPGLPSPLVPPSIVPPGPAAPGGGDAPAPDPQPDPDTPPGPAALLRTSPVDGEAGVSVSRETVIDLTAPVSAADVNATTVTATFSGRPVERLVHLSPDRRTITVFYKDRLPAASHVRVRVDADRIHADDGTALDGDGDGAPGGAAELDFDTLTLTALPGTSTCGHVYASEPAFGGGDVPLAHAVVSVDGREETLRAETDAAGAFCLDPSPAGQFFVHVDGRTVTTPKPAGSYYPFVGKLWPAAAGQVNDIGKVYLPLVAADALQPTSAVNDTPIGLPASTLAARPDLAGLSITVPADSLYSEDGSHGGKVGLALVPPDRLPGPLAEGLAPPYVITVQSDLGTNFDTPAPLCLPNLGSGAGPLPAGARSRLVSFNHDTGRWEPTAPMTVTSDGARVCTDPGTGVLAPGWHHTGPPPAPPPPPPPPPPNDDGQTAGFSRRATAAAGTPAEGPFLWRFTNLATGFDIRGRTGKAGTLDMPILAPSALTRLEWLQLSTLKIAQVQYTTGATESIGVKPPQSQLGPPPAADADGDGLSDQGEQIAGTDAGDADSDGDGIDDAVELRQGANPLDGRPVATGLIGSVDLPGDARDVDTSGQVAAVALGPAGAAVLDVADPTAPLVLSQVDTVGAGLAVAVTPTRLVVADGAQGITLFDVTDPASPSLVARTPLEDARRVVAGADVAYVALATKDVAVIDLETGDQIDAIELTEPAEDIVLAGDHVYVITRSRLVVLHDFAGGLGPVGDVPVLGAAPGLPASPPRNLFVGGGRAYVGMSGGPFVPWGYRVVDVSDPAAPLVIAAPTTVQPAIHDLAANGSGLLLAATEYSTPPRNLSLYDAGAANASTLVTSLAVPGDATAVAIVDGLAYVADGAAGLEIVNYRAFDTLGVPPSVTLSVPAAAEEGKPLLLSATVSDDIQVRRVDFSVDGVLIASDGGFPFEQRVITPSAGDPSLAVQARATDTGGNVTVSATATVAISADATAPTVRRFSPGADRAVTPGSALTVSAVFSEPIDPATLTPARLRVLAPGPDGVSGTGDDVALAGLVPSYRAASHAAVMELPTDLPVARYRIGAGPGIADVAGNAMPAEEATTFRVFQGDLTAGGHLDFAGNIDTPTATDVYTVKADAGAQVFLDVTAVDGACGASGLRYTLRRPDTTALLENISLASCSKRGPITLPAGGDYTLEVFGAAGALGSYAMRFWDVPQPDLLVTGIGATTTGELESPGRADEVAFDASAGQHVFVEIQAVRGACGASGMRYRLLDPDGVLVFGDVTMNACADHGPHALAKTGTYTLRVHAGTDSAETGTYTLKVWDAPIDTTAAAVGDTVEGAIESPGRADHHNFGGTAGQRVFFDVQSVKGGCGTSAMRYRLVDPDGIQVFDAFLNLCTDHGTTTLAKNGTYSLQVRPADDSAETGSYTIKLWNAPIDATPAAVGDTLTGAIESPGVADHHTFGATAGQRLFFDVLSVNGGCGPAGLRHRLVDPDGIQIFDAILSSCADRGPFTLAKTGSHTLQIGAGFDSAETGTYAIKLWDAPIDTGTLTPGTPVDGAVESPGAADSYTFAATAGQQVSTTVHAVDGGCGASALRQGVSGPGGTVLFDSPMSLCAGAGPQAVLTTGTHTLLVHPADNSDATGTYSLTVNLAGGGGGRSANRSADGSHVDIADAETAGAAEPPATAERPAYGELPAATADRTDAADRSRAAVAAGIRRTLRQIARRSLNPPRAARALAMVSVAQRDAIERLLAVDSAATATSQAAAARRAAEDVLAGLFADAAPAPAGAVTARSARAGSEAAAAVLARGTADGSSRPWSALVPDGPGIWQPTAPALAWPIEPLAGTWQTWNLRSATDVHVPPPPAAGSAALAAEMRAIHDLRLTPRRRAIARRWEARRGSVTPAGLWSETALGILDAEHATPRRAATVLAALNTAQADAMIVAWAVKYRYWTQRPITVIRRTLDTSWTPLLRTPSFPGYVSGHSATSSAAATVLGAAYPRRRASLSRRAREAGRSRLYGGIHIPSDDRAGARAGRATGRAAVLRYLTR